MKGGGDRLRVVHTAGHGNGGHGIRQGLGGLGMDADATGASSHGPWRYLLLRSIAHDASEEWWPS